MPTYALAYGLTEFPYIIGTVPNLTKCKVKNFAVFESRMNEFFLKATANYPDLLEVQVIWYPQYWSFTGDYSFQIGRIPPQPPLNQTLSQIYERSRYTQVGTDCYQKLIADNLKSATLRECKVPCEDLMYSTDFETGLSSEQRYLNIGTERLLNCTNHNLDLHPFWSPVLAYEKRQVDTLDLNRYDEQFAGLRYHFLTKMDQGGAGGYPEFLTEDLLTFVYGMIGCDGCVRMDGDTPDDVQVLTALAAAIFSQALRLIQEEANGLPIFNGPKLL